jgi:hypothetical protein
MNSATTEDIVNKLSSASEIFTPAARVLTTAESHLHFEDVKPAQHLALVNESKGDVTVKIRQHIAEIAHEVDYGLQEGEAAVFTTMPSTTKIECSLKDPKVGDRVITEIFEHHPFANRQGWEPVEDSFLYLKSPQDQQQTASRPTPALRQQQTTHAHDGSLEEQEQQASEVKEEEASEVKEEEASEVKEEVGSEKAERLKEEDQMDEPSEHVRLASHQSRRAQDVCLSSLVTAVFVISIAALLANIQGCPVFSL